MNMHSECITWEQTAPSLMRRIMMCMHRRLTIQSTVAHVGYRARSGFGTQLQAKAKAKANV